MKPVIYKLSNIRSPLTGVGRYSIELIREVLKLRPNIAAVKNGRLHSEQEDLKGLLATFELSDNSDGSSGAETALNPTQRFRNIIGNIPFSRGFYRHIDNFLFSRSSSFLISQGAVYHDLNYTLDTKSGKNVSTVYDLSNIICPETHPAHRVKYLNNYFKKLSIGDSKIITISHAVKSELLEHYGIPEHRVHVTHLAADSLFKPRSKSECKEVLQQSQLDYKKYVLCVGTLEPRKNLSTVLTAYESLDKQVQQEFPLVLAGPMGWKSSILETRIRRLQARGVVKQLGFVSQNDLPMLYSGAIAFVYPSLYEGFGLPLLEAMQSGCPSITSNTGALAEVSNDAAIQVNPLENDEIANAISQLLHDSELNSYYVGAGQQRAKCFSWAKTASETCKIYDSL